MAGCGLWSQDVILNKTSKISTFKTALVCDSRIIMLYSDKQNDRQIMIQTNGLVMSFTLNDMDDIAFWTDSKSIYSSPINKSVNVKVIIIYFSLYSIIMYYNIV